MRKALLISMLLIWFLVDMSFGVLNGEGTDTNPYLIGTRADFDEFADPANASIYWTTGVHIKLVCDLNLSDTVYTQAVVAPDANTGPFFQGTQFDGVFDGNSNIISNLTIVSSDNNYIGLFGSMGNGSQVKNLKLTDIEIEGRSYVGGMCGWNQGGAVISSYVTGRISGYYSVGGMVGANWDSISSCYTIVTVNGSEIVGGLVGYNHGPITYCYTIGEVVGSSYSTGGLIGTNRDIVLTCFASGTVSGFGDVGGLVGNNDSFGGTYEARIESCYADVSVVGSSQIGGLCGWNFGGVINQTFSSGSVVGDTLNIGGLCGLNDGIITSSFWDKNSSGQNISDGGTAKTTAEMKTLSTFTAQGWNFTNIWGIGNGQTYPYLRPLTGINMADINYSGRVDMEDLAILVANWLKESD